MIENVMSDLISCKECSYPTDVTEWFWDIECDYRDSPASPTLSVHFVFTCNECGATKQRSAVIGLMG